MPLPIRSMTGYALVRQETSAGELTVSLRSVNHRGLDLHFYLATEFAPFENALRSLLKERLGRGHVEIRMSLVSEAQNDRSGYNRELLKRYLTAFRQADAEFGLHSKPDLNVLLGLPGIWESARDTKPLSPSFAEEAVAVAGACVDELNSYRDREGRELQSAIVRELDALDESRLQIAAVRSDAVPQFAARLQERLRSLLGDQTLPPNRLIEEAAVLADRSDVQEELTRLEVHSRELRRMLDDGGEVGKCLDFLLQEINRETNTILSKSSALGDSGLTITNAGVQMKANIERMREQALNLE
jgi:uncharacterized protein (TIGR00255 family)